MAQDKQTEALNLAIDDVKKVLEKHKDDDPDIKIKYEKLKQIEKRRHT